MKLKKNLFGSQIHRNWPFIDHKTEISASCEQIFADSARLLSLLICGPTTAASPYDLLGILITTAASSYDLMGILTTLPGCSEHVLLQLPWGGQLFRLCRCTSDGRGTQYCLALPECMSVFVSWEFFMFCTVCFYCCL